MSEIECIGCKELIYPVKQPSLRGGPVRLSCPRCQCMLPATILDQAETAPVIPIRHESPVTVTHRVEQEAPKMPRPDASAPLDPEGQCRARLAWIDARLAEVEPLRAERDKLQRMLDAAAPPSGKRATG